MINNLIENWYVYVGEQVYGPFSETIMVGFVGEGRIISTSLISNMPNDGFVAAEKFSQFQFWNNGQIYQTPSHTQAQAQAQVNSTRYEQRADTYQPQSSEPKRLEQNSKHNIFIVMAEIDGKSAMSFLRTLQGFGHVQRIGDAMWILKSTHALDAINQALSPTLARRDRLFIHDCQNNKQAWSNIGADLDKRLVNLWKD